MSGCAIRKWMNEPATSWDHWRSFLAVTEAGSLSGAARVLGLTQPTLGRHIAQLEAALGLVLFTRAPQGLLPMPAARDLLPQARAMQSSAAALLRVAAGAAGGERGTVRLTASEVIGGAVLPPVITGFAADHPGIAVEIVLSNLSGDLLRREADIAVRMFRPTQSALRVRKLGLVDLGLYAEPGYLARRGAPERLSDLSEHALIGPDSRFDGMVLGGRALGASDFQLRSDSDLAQLALVQAGAGIGVVQEGVARRCGLQRVLPAEAFRLEVWLAMHEDLAEAREVRLVWDHLVAEVPAILRG